MVERYPQAERKLIYRVLHGQLTANPELMESRLLDDLQRLLHKEAQAEGVDIADHAAWDRWLGNQPGGCVVQPIAPAPRH